MPLALACFFLMLLIQAGETYPTLLCKNCELKAGEILRAQCEVDTDYIDTNITLSNKLLPTQFHSSGSVYHYSTSTPVDYTTHLQNLTCTTRTSSKEIQTISEVVKVKFDPIIENATCDPQTPKSLSDDYFEYKVTIIGLANPIPDQDSIQFKFDNDKGNVTPTCEDCDKGTDPTCFILQYLVRDIKKKDFEDGAEAFFNIGGITRTISCPPTQRNGASGDNVRYGISSVIRLSLWTLIVTISILG